MKKKLEELYDNIDVTDAGWIDDFRSLYSYKIGDKNLSLPTVEMMDDVCDEKIKFKDIENIIEYEHQQIKRFKEIEDQIEECIDDSSTLKADEIEKLQEDLKEYADVFSKFYLTLGDEYHSFEEKAEELLEKLDEMN